MLMDEPFNEIMYSLMLQIMGWLAESESTTKSNRVKMSVKHTTAGITVSYKGNKWGRKSLPKQTINRVIGLYSEGKSIRQIAAVVQVYDKNNNGRQISVGAVHKILAEYRAQKDSILTCSTVV
jgi:DNA invertase Pin-like site-specific DNA recombinase